MGTYILLTINFLRELIMKNKIKKKRKKNFNHFNKIIYTPLYEIFSSIPKRKRYYHARASKHINANLTNAGKLIFDTWNYILNNLSSSLFFLFLFFSESVYEYGYGGEPEKTSCNKQRLTKRMEIGNKSSTVQFQIHWKVFLKSMHNCICRGGWKLILLVFFYNFLIRLRWRVLVTRGAKSSTSMF